MNYPTTVSDWLIYMSNIHVSAIDMGLSRVLPVAEKLGIFNEDLENQPYVFTVAGTNGKGSTTALISEICIKAGYKTALYQSPHLVSFNERIKINGVEVDDEMLMRAFHACEKARTACDVSLSFFEMTTLAAFWIFKSLHCQVWVLEIGLGGRLDVVNLIDPDVCLITNVGIDHVDWLGDDREKIGFEKAGIIRQGSSTVIYGEQDMPDSVAQIIRDKNATCHQYNQDYAYDTPCDYQADEWIYTNKAVTLVLPMPSIAINNASTAISGILASDLKVPLDAIKEGLRSVTLLGRFDKRMVHDRQWVFDVGHNTHGIAFLMKSFIAFWQRYQDRHPSAKLHVVFSMLADKDIDGVLSFISSFDLPIEAWYVGQIDNVRATQVTQLVDKIRHHVSGSLIFAHDSIAEAVQDVAYRADKGDVILCFGSFHTIAESMIALGLESPPNGA